MGKPLLEGKVMIQEKLCWSRFYSLPNYSAEIQASKRKTILIHGCAGGVGGYAIQLAKQCGLTVYTTCHGRDLEYVKTLGADKAIDYINEDVNQVVLEYYAQSNLAAIGNKFAKLIADKYIMPPAITVISMEDIPEYLVKLKEGKVTGKIVAKIM
ncbi:zinc-binding dehydrogenase [Paenibacillus sp. IHBB 3054]|uniref:zinc-binding dehydrogenase n=1 Tax=Paenibacillus sp. IHBB 3054 TaxID=3425689 RepID=UPI003F661FF5